LQSLVVVAVVFVVVFVGKSATNTCFVERPKYDKYFATAKPERADPDGFMPAG
jgi:hypothetical protein